jgi:hypothetical protein
MIRYIIIKILIAIIGAEAQFLNIINNNNNNNYNYNKEEVLSVGLKRLSL